MILDYPKKHFGWKFINAFYGFHSSLYNPQNLTMKRLNNKWQQNNVVNMLSRTIFYLLHRLFHRLDERGKNCFKAFLMVSKSVAHSSQTSIIFSFDSCIIGKVYNDGLNTLFIVPYHCVKSVRIFHHTDWIRRDTEHLSVFSPDTGKYGLE